MTTITADRGTTQQSQTAERAWAAEVLGADDLQLAAARLEPYGRARLGVFSKILLWGMRFYVLLSFVLIAAQIYISLKH